MVTSQGPSRPGQVSCRTGGPGWTPRDGDKKEGCAQERKQQVGRHRGLGEPRRPLNWPQCSVEVGRGGDVKTRQAGDLFLMCIRMLCRTNQSNSLRCSKKSVSTSCRKTISWPKPSDKFWTKKMQSKDLCPRGLQSSEADYLFFVNSEINGEDSQSA